MAGNTVPLPLLQLLVAACPLPPTAAAAASTAAPPLLGQAAGAGVAAGCLVSSPRWLSLPSDAGCGVAAHHLPVVLACLSESFLRRLAALSSSCCEFPSASEADAGAASRRVLALPVLPPTGALSTVLMLLALLCCALLFRCPRRRALVAAALSEAAAALPARSPAADVLRWCCLLESLLAVWHGAGCAAAGGAAHRAAFPLRMGAFCAGPPPAATPLPTARLCAGMDAEEAPGTAPELSCTDCPLALGL